MGNADAIDTLVGIALGTNVIFVRKRTPFSNTLSNNHLNLIPKSSTFNLEARETNGSL